MNRVLILLLFVAVIPSCDRMRVKRMVTDWISREILMPDSLVFTIKGVDTLDFNLDTTRFKLLTYVNAGSCFECMARLKDWNYLWIH